MISAQLIVSISHKHETASPVDSTADEAKRIQRCLVGPVRVFDHHHRRELELTENRGQKSVATRLARHQMCDRPHVLKRSERPGGREGIARS